MRNGSLMLVLILAASPAMAQSYPQQPQQQAYVAQQLSDNYNPTIPAYNQPQYTPPPQPAPAHTQPQPGQYGQSVTTDIRQMNF